jgi:hypothetical protein
MSLRAQLLDHLEVARLALQSAAYIAEAKGWDELAILGNLTLEVEAAKDTAAQLDSNDAANKSNCSSADTLVA